MIFNWNCLTLIYFQLKCPLYVSELLLTVVELKYAHILFTNIVEKYYKLRIRHIISELYFDSILLY